ncbi:MAG TPA: histidinol-phosphate transaminase [Candidatus Omnitrophota bacterium]|nr:histidinol-phosphate transaminase [Candidatus Omnitrophota bacterium]
MKNVIKKTVLESQPYIPGKPIQEVKRELGLKDVIKVASNENPYPPSPQVIAAMRKESKNVNRYPDSSCFYLREQLAKQLKVKPTQLVFGNGSDEIIVLAVRAFIKPGDEIVIAKPTFLIYNIASCMEGGVVKEVPIKDFQYDLKGMLAQITSKTRIIFIGNPDNPCGAYIPQKKLENFVSKVPDDVLIFLDEAYFEYVQAKDYGSSIDMVSRYKNVLVARTFSKIYGLAGLRIGYAIGDEELIDWLNRLREPFNVNSMAQAAALACLKDKIYYKNITKEIERQRQFLYKSFKSLELKFVKTFTNFILIFVPGDSTDVCQKLLQKGVIVRDMRGWGLKNYIRISIGTAQENKKVVQTLKEIL